jgi:hypothetical protein
MCNVPLDDAVGEGPHAFTKHVQQHATASKWGWAASSLRLTQNLKDLPELCDAIPCELQESWDAYSSVIKPPGARLANSKVRMKRCVFENRLYHMGHAFNLDAAERAVEDDVPVAPSDPDVVGALEDGGDDAGDDGGDDGQDGADDGDDGQDGADDQGGRIHQKREDDVTRLMRGYFSSALEVSSYISVPVLSDDGTNSFPQAMQVLSLETRNIVTPTWEDYAKEPGLFRCTVQPLERWSEELLSGARVLNVFAVADPIELDLLELIGLDFSVRSNVFAWTVALSDVADCVAMIDPVVLKPKVALGSPKIPVLCLMDELDFQGWKPSSQTIVHVPSAPLLYDSRGAPSKRHYYQCLLALESLWAKGVLDFKSDLSGAFFNLLLASSTPIEGGLSGKECKRRLALTDERPLKIRALEMAARDAPAPAPLLALVDVDIAGGDDGPIVDEPPLVPLALADRSPPTPVLRSPSRSVSSSSSSSSSTSSSPSSRATSNICGDSGSDVGDDVQIPAEILGCPVKVEHHLARVASHGLRVDCPNTGHHRCSKFRSLGLWQDKLGRAAAAKYIETWLSVAADFSEQDHKAWKPTLDEVNGYFASKP